ncbi:SRPBCC family protein [Ampullimonas aquatilis]|uniref:SRPBCC family protein n=1 Tax=Ampullimonas aquatilis TaxID=1341549 RepID=UPI003C759712
MQLTNTAIPQTGQFDLVSDWQIDAPITAVWAALQNPLDWPQWWPYVKLVQCLNPGLTKPGRPTTGQVYLVIWSSRLRYQLLMVVTVQEVVVPQKIVVSATGDVSGCGEWTLRATANGTAVNYRWQVVVDKTWMRWLLPVARRLFAWNHRAVMDAGQQGLQAYLNGQIAQG